MIIKNLENKIKLAGILSIGCFATSIVISGMVLAFCFSLVKAERKPDIVDEEDDCNIVSDKVGVITKINAKNGTLAVNVGDTVKVYGKIKEGNRERIQVFEGTVIKKQNGSNRTTFTVRKLSNGVGVEKTWPLHSPNVEKVEIVRKGKVRRAKLYYLRDRIGKAAKVKELVK